MRAYWAILSAQFRMLLQYRVAAAAGFATQVFWGLIRLMILEAFYRSDPNQAFSLGQMTAYIWLGQAFLVTLPWNVTTQIRDMINSGTVAYELLRPLDLYNLWFSRVLAQRTAPGVMRALPIFVLAGLFWGLHAPPTLASGLAFGATMVGAVLLSCAITMLMNISLLWTISGEGITQLFFAGGLLLTGMIIPLPLLPDWTQKALAVLPFRGIADAPYRVYSGHIPAEQVWGVLLHQAVWTVGLVALGRWVLARGLRRVVVQGG